MYVTRKEWGAAPRRGGPGLLQPSRVEGLAVHWPATSQPIRGVANVSAALRGWQRYHQQTLGWSDIGYQEAIDQDGNVYRLRGLAVQSGANGNTDVNERFGALLLVLAPGEDLSPAMIAAVRRRVARHRDKFPNSRRIVGHADIRPEPTACPGPAATAAIRAGKLNPQVSQVTRARRRLEAGVDALEAAGRHLARTTPDRTTARRAGVTVVDMAADLEALLERLPKR